jgi:hypothetical protein
VRGGERKDKAREVGVYPWSQIETLLEFSIPATMPKINASKHTTLALAPLKCPEYFERLILDTEML